jgi:hypothetical protein
VQIRERVLNWLHPVLLPRCVSGPRLNSVYRDVPHVQSSYLLPILNRPSLLPDFCHG